MFRQLSIQTIWKKNPKFWHWLRLIVLGAIVTGLVNPLIATAYINVATQDERYTNPDRVPQGKVAIVFGAGLLANGKPTPFLASRIETAVKLYQLNRVERLLMTGDNSTVAYNEVKSMQEYATVAYNEVKSMQEYAHELGVPLQNITLDYAGFSTYESCYRARKIFGVDRAVVITQNYHLPRTVYTCDRLGVKTVGLGTADLEIYGWRGMLPDWKREMFANVKALVEVNITRPRPTFLGSFEGIE
jgi:vancomycin permeability regulator SanA